MIAQRRMHPSVVVWSVGNEFPSDREPVARYVARATALVRELDPSRLVTFASDRREKDISFDTVDFIADQRVLRMVLRSHPGFRGRAGQDAREVAGEADRGERVRVGIDRGVEERGAEGQRHGGRATRRTTT